MHTALYTCDDVNDIGGGDAANDARGKYRFVVLRALGRNVDDDYDEMRMQRNAIHKRMKLKKKKQEKNYPFIEQGEKVYMGGKERKRHGEIASAHR